MKVQRKKLGEKRRKRDIAGGRQREWRGREVVEANGIKR